MSMAQEKAKAGRPMSLAAMFRQAPEEDVEHVDLTLPPIRARGTRINGEDATPAVDLSGSAKLWLMIGPGGAGKTLFARWIGGVLLEKGQLDRVVIAALDPTNRTLAAFFDGVMQPETANPAQTASWLRDLLKFVMKQRASGVVDLGGGDLSLAHMIDAAPDFYNAMEEAGVAPVAAYMLSPRVDDLASMATFEGRGFKPRATALVLNLGRAETPAAFDAVRRHPAYRAALDRGAMELWVPRLEPEALALEIERKRLQFHQARDGQVPEGRKVAPIGGMEGAIVREWLERMDAEIAQRVPSWVPWA